MTNPIIPVSSAAITDSSGKLTVAGRDFLRQIVAKLQTQINDLSSADSHIADLLASLTDSDGNLLDLSALNVDELVAIAAVQLPGFMYRDALGQWYGCTLDGQAAAASGDVKIIAPATHAATSKVTPVDADEIPLVDSAASNGLKKLTWLNLLNTVWTRLGGLIAGGTPKTTPVDADSFALCDSAASNATKQVTLTNAWLNYFKPKADLLYASSTLSPWTTVFKTSDTSRSSTTTLTADPHLSVALASGHTYNIRGEIYINQADGTMGNKFSTVYSGTNNGLSIGEFIETVVNAATANTNTYSQVSGSVVATGGGNGSGTLVYRFSQTITTTSAGTLDLKWAQNVSSVNSLTWRVGSYLEWALVA